MEVLEIKQLAMNKEKPTSSSRNLLVDVLAVLFGISSWVDINGLWVELPVMVQRLPEAWHLASYVVITTQLANLGPLIFSAARRLWSHKMLEVPAIHTTLAIGLISCLLLAFFWERTTFIGSQFHSTALLSLAFCLSFVDCTSSVLYLPFMANFREKYVISYLVGEGMSGLLPSIMALAQGVGGNSHCQNVTIINVTEFGNITTFELHLVAPEPRFSVQIFFFFLCAMLSVSWIAFVLLNILPQIRDEWVRPPAVYTTPAPPLAENFMASVSEGNSCSTEFESSTECLTSNKKRNIPGFYQLLAIQTYLCTIQNGVLAIQTYSCLPYGNVVYHLAVNLSSIANPACCFLAMFLPIWSVTSVAILTVFGSCWTAYILTTAVLSPQPPLVEYTAGAVLVVLSWVVFMGTSAFVKARIAAILRQGGGFDALYWCGVVTQVGSAIGALVTFVIVNYTQVFQDYSPCVS